MPNPTSSPVRRFYVELDGYCAEPFEAASADKAKYAAFKAFREAAWKISFRDFLSRVVRVYPA